jgi:hypothetical protein
MLPKVFVNYARDESKKVYHIPARLEERGIKFRVDTKEIRKETTGGA